jgi:hypothetical protein
VLLCIVSFGIYEIYWFYKNWKFIKENNKLNISPFWRAIFAYFFAYGLFKNIFALAKEKGYKGEHSPGFLTFCFIAISILWKLPDPYWLISMFSFLPLTAVVKVLNYYWRQEQPNLKERTRFSGGEIALLVVGGRFLILVLIGIFMPE